eukprot:192549-Chlamydomonas_euryale.AAC.1
MHHEVDSLLQFSADMDELADDEDVIVVRAAGKAHRVADDIFDGRDVGWHHRAVDGQQHGLALQVHCDEQVARQRHVVQALVRNHPRCTPSGLRAEVEHTPGARGHTRGKKF